MADLNLTEGLATVFLAGFAIQRLVERLKQLGATFVVSGTEAFNTAFKYSQYAKETKKPKSQKPLGQD